MGRKMTIKAASKELNLTEHFLRQYIRNGEIPYLLAGSRYILDVDEVEEILRKKALDNMHRQGGMQRLYMEFYGQSNRNLTM